MHKTQKRPKKRLRFLAALLVCTLLLSNFSHYDVFTHVWAEEQTETADTEEISLQETAVITEAPQTEVQETEVAQVTEAPQTDPAPAETDGDVTEEETSETGEPSQTTTEQETTVTEGFQNESELFEETLVEDEKEVVVYLSSIEREVWNLINDLGNPTDEDLMTVGDLNIWTFDLDRIKHRIEKYSIDTTRIDNISHYEEVLSKVKEAHPKVLQKAFNDLPDVEEVSLDSSEWYSLLNTVYNIRKRVTWMQENGVDTTGLDLAKLEAWEEKEKVSYPLIAQIRIDNLPDATAKDFELLTQKQCNVYKARLNDIETYMKKNGVTESQLDMVRYNNLKAACERFDALPPLTMAEIDAFIDANFPDANFAAATKQAVRDYYQFDGADNDILINDSDDYNDEGIGPKTFSTPEEALSWLGEFNINVKALDIECVEGLQYLGKECVIETGEDKDIKLVLTGGVDLQKFFGKLCSSSTLLYCRLTSDDIYSVGRLTEDGYFGNKSTLTLPRFYGGSVQIATLTNMTKKTPLVYLRDGKEKQFYVYDDVKKSATGEDLIKEGLTTWDIGKLTSETESDRWKMVSKGSDETNVKWNLNLDNWDRFETMVRAVSGQISYDFEYKLSVAYYSYVDVDFNCEIYGGFEFKKVSENNKELSLEGAQFVVSNEAGEYLVSEGGNGKTAEFSTDITKAKIYTSGADGTFKVERIPVANADDANENGQVTATYYVTEVKAASGYKLDSTPVPVTVTASVAGIATEYAGGETNVKVNSDNLKLYPQWEKENQLMVLSDGTTTANEKKDAETHDLYIKNAGKEITMDYDIDADTFEVLREATFNICNLEDAQDEDGNPVIDEDGNPVKKVVADGKSLEGVADEINSYINSSSMDSVYDSYEVVTTETMICYDKTSVEKNSNTTDENNYKMTNAPLPVKVDLTAIKTLVGGVQDASVYEQLQAGDFQFELVRNGNNSEGDPVESAVTVTNDADGKIVFPTLAYTQPGTYSYAISETVDWYRGEETDDANITFDKTVHSLEIQVTESADVGLIITVFLDEKEVQIANNNSFLQWEVSYPHLTDEGICADDETGEVEIKQNAENTPETIDVGKFENERILSSLEISKIVSGNMGDRTARFDFCLNITVPNDSNPTPEELKYVLIDADGERTEYSVSGSKGQFWISLAHRESIIFLDLPVGTTYVVYEDMGKSEGYEVSSSNTSGTLTKDGVKVTFYNEKNVAVPTKVGIDPTIAVAVVFVALAGLFLVFWKKIFGKMSSRS